jgi:hypothetical protein
VSVVDREELFEVTIPAGTAQAAPVTVNCPFPDGIVTDIEFVVPPGPSGLMGFHLAYGGVQQLPRTAGAFYVTDTEVIRRTIRSYPTGGRWQIRGYNTDVYAHTIEVRFLVDEFPPKQRVSTPIPTITQPNQLAPALEG